MAWKKNHFATTRLAELEMAKIYNISSLALRREDSMLCKVGSFFYCCAAFVSKFKMSEFSLLCYG